MNQLPFDRDLLWKGCIYASIAHAIMVAVYPSLNYEQSWDGCNYSVQDGCGARGTITFSDDICIGAFRDEKSPRLKGKILLAQDYFAGAISDILEIAKSETLQYLLDEYDGKILPLITSSFWSVGKDLYSNDTFGDMIANGGFLIENQRMDIVSASGKWAQYYGITNRQQEMLTSLYDRRISIKGNILLNHDEKAALLGMKGDIAESRLSFREMNIDWID